MLAFLSGIYLDANTKENMVSSRGKSIALWGDKPETHEWEYWDDTRIEWVSVGINSAHLRGELSQLGMDTAWQEEGTRGTSWTSVMCKLSPDCNTCSKQACLVRLPFSWAPELGVDVEVPPEMSFQRGVRLPSNLSSPPKALPAQKAAGEGGWHGSDGATPALAPLLAEDHPQVRSSL